MGPRVAAQREELESQRRGQILKAALAVFARKGFHGATVAEIAREARLSEGTIYNYFRSKEDLLISLPREILVPTFIAPFLAEKGRQPPETFLQEVVTHTLERFLANIDVLRVLISSVPILDEAAREEYLRRTVIFGAEALEKYFQEEMARGTYRPLNPAILARAFTGMCIIFVVLQEVLLGKRIVPLAYEEIAREVVDLFLHGALATPQGTTSAS